MLFHAFSTLAVFARFRLMEWNGHGQGQGQWLLTTTTTTKLALNQWSSRTEVYRRRSCVTCQVTSGAAVDDGNQLIEALVEIAEQTRLNCLVFRIKIFLYVLLRDIEFSMDPSMVIQKSVK